jgi:hypothetical protein
MKLISIINSITCFVILIVYANDSIAVSEIATYSNSEYGVSFSYPSSWIREPNKPGPGIAKIVSQNGYGDEGCSLSVMRSASLKSITMQEYIKQFSSPAFLNEFRRSGYEDAIIHESGKTKVFNRDAYYLIMSYSIQTMGERISMKSLMVYTIKNDTQYTFACGTAEPQNFPKVYPVFKAIIGSLFIDPTR